MEVTAVDILDSFRFCIGLYAAQFLFCVNAFPRRRRFGISVAAGILTAVASALLYVPLVYGMERAGFVVNVTARFCYWTGMTFMMCLVIRMSFCISVCSALFRGLMASGLEGICMAVVKYMLAYLWYPQFAEGHFAGYVIVNIVVYSFLYYLTWRILAVKMQASSGLDELENGLTFFAYVLFYIIFTLVIYATEYIFESILVRTAGMKELYYTLGIFVLMVLIMVNVLKMGFQHYIYDMAVLRNERNIFAQLMEEKRLQYEFSRENIETVNRKCHDLKHQLLALEAVDGSERQKMIEEALKSVEFYDSAVKTGNEVLDVLLTEKSVLCAKRGIRFSCMVHVESLEQIGIVDLYTMLGNALDNAIECVEKFEDRDSEKKIISLNADTRGNMLYLSVENYYEGEIRLFRGLPVTSKSDSQNHGIGIRSIQRIAQSYGGDIRIYLQDHIFVLQIAIPFSK